jgi:hypothetical protein
VQSPCNPLINDYADIFYTIDEGVIPSIQCKTCLKRLKSMRKIDVLNVIFAVFCGPALKSRLNSTETSLHFSENTCLCGLSRYTVGAWGKSFMCILTILWHPCLYIPWRRNSSFDRDSEISLKKKRSNKLNYTENFKLDHLHSKSRYHVVSEVFKYPRHVIF